MTLVHACNDETAEPFWQFSGDSVGFCFRDEFVEPNLLNFKFWMKRGHGRKLEIWKSERGKLAVPEKRKLEMGNEKYKGGSRQRKKIGN